jgi:uncharacterized protein YkuJ
VTASQLLSRFERLEILKEATGKKKQRRFVFKDYVAILSHGTEL